MAQRQLDPQARARRYRVDKQFLDEERRLEAERRHLEDNGIDLTHPNVIDLTIDDQVIKEEKAETVDQLVEPLVSEEQPEEQRQHDPAPPYTQTRRNTERGVNAERLPRKPVAQQTLPPQKPKQPSIRLAKQVQDRFPTIIPNPDKNGFLELHCPDADCRANCGQNGMFLRGYSGIHGHVSGHAPEVVRGLDKEQILPLCIKKSLTIRAATQMLKHPRAAASYKVERVSMKRGPETKTVPPPKRRKGSKVASYPDSEDDDAELYVARRTRQRRLTINAADALAVADEYEQKTNHRRLGHVSESISTAASGPPIAKPGQMGSKKSPPSPGKDELIAGRKLMSKAEDPTAEEDEEEPVRNGNRRQRKLSLFFAPRTFASEREAEHE